MQKLLFSCIFMACLASLHAFPGFDNFGQWNNFGDLNNQQDTPDAVDFNDLYGDVNEMGDTPDTPDAVDGGNFDVFAQAAAAAGQVAGQQAAGGDSSGPDSGEMSFGSFVGGMGSVNAGGMGGMGGGNFGAGGGMGGGNFGGMRGFIGNPGNDFDTNDNFDNNPGMLNSGRVMKRRGNSASIGIAIATIALVVGAATVAIVVIRKQRQSNMQSL